MRSFSAVVTTALSFAIAVAAGSCANAQGMVSCETTIPSCLQSCIDTYNLCSACHVHRSNVQSCINNVCGHPPLGQRAHAHVYFDSLCAVNGYKSGRGGGIVEIADRCSLADYERGLAAQRDIVERGDGEARRATRALVWQG